LAAALLAVATPAGAFQQAVRPATTTTVPTVAAPAATSTPTTSTTSTAAPKTYAECLRSYAARTNATAVCQRLFPNATPSTTTPAATTPSTSTGTTSATPTREPVDITPQVDKLLDAWRNRPKTTPKPPADPLAVIPEIQAACAAYVGAAERWRRCTLDRWRTAGLKGSPPLVLQNPPVVEPPPVQPPVVQPPSNPPPVVQPPVVRSKPPVQTPPPLTPETVEPEPVSPVVIAEPEPPTSVQPASPPAVAPPPAPKPPATPIWFWLLALVAAAGVGFGVAKLLSRAKTPSSRPAKVSPAPCPVISLVADPGVVVLTPDGPPRAGMAVSLRFDSAADGGEVALDYPTLETAP
jgi:hypothetical protein